MPRSLPSLRAMSLALLCALAALPAASLGAPAAASPGAHLRGGIWDQLIYWIVPGPAAYGAIEAVVARASAARRAAGLPALLASAKSPLIVAFYEEHDGRGPDGQPLSEPWPNREMFVATFVRIEGGDPAVFFLADPLRSSAELTAKGVPGSPASCGRQVARAAPGTGPTTTRAEWRCTSPAGDVVELTAAYADGAAKAVNRQPDAPEYLAANLEGGTTLLFASRPTETFDLQERAQSFWYELPGPAVQVSLTARLRDAELDSMLNDKGNVPRRLIELRRLVRIERREPGR